MKSMNRITKMFSLKLTVSAFALSGLFLATNTPAYAEGHTVDGPGCAGKVDSMPIEKNVDLGKEIVLGPLQNAVVVPAHAPRNWEDCLGFSWIKVSPDLRGIAQIQPAWSGVNRDAATCSWSGMDFMLYSKRLFPNFPNPGPVVGWKYEGGGLVLGNWVNGRCNYSVPTPPIGISQFGEFRVAVRSWYHDHTDNCSNGQLAFLPWSGTTMPYCFYHTIVARTSR